MATGFPKKDKFIFFFQGLSLSPKGGDLWVNDALLCCYPLQKQHAFCFSCSGYKHKLGSPTWLGATGSPGDQPCISFKSIYSEVPAEESCLRGVSVHSSCFPTPNIVGTFAYKEKITPRIRT